MRRPLPLLVLPLVLVACGAPEATPRGTVAADAPLLGKADGTDTADRGCQIVLREAARVPGDTGGYETSCVEGRCWVVWAGTVDVAEGALREGAAPQLLWHTSFEDGWWSVPAETPVEGAPAGFRRFAFRLDSHTVAEGVSTTSLERLTISLIPYLRTTAGGRVFDHNRVPGDLDAYTLSREDGWSVAEDPGACAPLATPPGQARLTFHDDWTIEEAGAPVAGGELRIAYDLDRLTDCRGTHNGYPAWDLLAHVRFLPGGQEASGTVRAFQTSSGVPQNVADAVPFVTDIPRDASRLEIWFENVAVGTCQAWDSNYGENYGFEVLTETPRVGWAGNVGGSFDRACTHVDGLSEPVVVTSWTRERACMFVDVDVWVPGVTDAAALHPQWLVAEVETRWDDGPTRTEPLDFVEKVGNDYRYRWTLPREEMIRTEWQAIAFAFRFSVDGGATWFRVGQGEGPGGGAPRTIERDPSF